MSKKNKLKVFVNGDSSYFNFLDDTKFDIVYEYKSADIVIFTGGPDVHPKFYGESVGSNTLTNDMRDNNDKAIYDVINDKFKIGICRGAQFLTVMSGGKLYQDVSGHAIRGTHGLDISYDDLSLVRSDVTQAAYINVTITSTHHQMMRPFNLKADQYHIIAWAYNPLSIIYMNGSDYMQTPPKQEPEIVWYPETKSLCIQGHPERMEESSEAVKFIRKLVDKYYKLSKIKELAKSFD